MNFVWNKIEHWGYFPEQVNQNAARIVALFVALLSVAALLLWAPLSLVLFPGFLLRAWRGPQIDPLARFALWAAPSGQQTPGSPKRFAQILGALLSLGIALSWFLGSGPLWTLLIVILFVLSSLEALGGICLGCRIFALAIRRGWLSEESCSHCAD